VRFRWRGVGDESVSTIVKELVAFLLSNFGCRLWYIVSTQKGVYEILPFEFDRNQSAL
jgi:hypothetical protein